MNMFKHEKETGKVRQEIKPFKHCHRNHILALTPRPFTEEA
jgi:hypothetical protein